MHRCISKTRHPRCSTPTPTPSSWSTTLGRSRSNLRPHVAWETHVLVLTTAAAFRAYTLEHGKEQLRSSPELRERMKRLMKLASDDGAQAEDDEEEQDEVLVLESPDVRVPPLPVASRLTAMAAAHNRMLLR